MDNQNQLEKPFKVISVSRVDIVNNELMTESEALKLTDSDMERIAEWMGGYNFDDSLWYAVDYIKKESNKK